jgi:hypothetical protein
MKMKQLIRGGLVALGVIAVLAGGAWTTGTLVAQAGHGGMQHNNGKEAHPVLRESIHQIEGVKDRLQKAPTDFGGHRERAVDALNHALGELRDALQFDKK